jgi:hypothetical protein
MFVAMGLGAGHEAHAQVAVVIEPPAAWVATVQPEYFEGRPVYYYGDHWYYRDRGRWAFYHSEPRYLYERRGRWVGHGYVGHDRVIVHERYRYRR